MAVLRAVYKCEVCGNIVEVLHSGAGQLVCCGEPMKKMEENTAEAATEHKEGVSPLEAKHVPVIDGNKVIVGSVEHPMSEEHYIGWIEAEEDSGEICKVFLKPEDKPQATFSFEPTRARAYCNLHGLWKSE